MPLKVAVLQSNYLPWKGYFDLIHDVDEFIFYDDLQYTKNDWRNRNLIKTPKGTQWLTIPVGINLNRLICEVELKDKEWAQQHWRLLQQHYKKAPYFHHFSDFFEDVYLQRDWSYLSDLNQHLIKVIAKDFLNIQTTFKDSRSYDLSGTRLDRLLELIKKTKATCYVSGPSAKQYIDPARFSEINVELEWKDYSGYPEYPQFHPPFTHQVSILDLLFQTGPNASQFIWGWRENSPLSHEPS